MISGAQKFISESVSEDISHHSKAVEVLKVKFWRFGAAIPLNLR